MRNRAYEVSANVNGAQIILDGNNRILMANRALKTSFGDWIGEKEIVEEMARYRKRLNYNMDV